MEELIMKNLSVVLTVTDINILAKIIEGQTGPELGKYQRIRNLIIVGLKATPDSVEVSYSSLINFAEYLNLYLDRGKHGSAWLEFLLFDAIRIIKNVNFFVEKTRLNALDEKTRNIVSVDVKGKRKVKVGDNEISTESFDRKNVIEGNVEDVGKLIIGDGH